MFMFCNVYVCYVDVLFVSFSYSAMFIFCYVPDLLPLWFVMFMFYAHTLLCICFVMNFQWQRKEYRIGYMPTFSKTNFTSSKYVYVLLPLYFALLMFSCL